MRFRVRAHGVTASEFSRHVPTQEEGIARAREATKRWVKDHPEDAQHWTEQPAEPQAASTSVEPKIVLPSFATTLFNCIVANPVCQVWQCVAREGERKTAGRPRKDGSRAQAKAPITHDIGECAILMSNMEPVRNPDGSVKVYSNWTHAAEAALEIYHLADEEDSFPWKEDHPLVYQTERVQVLFDPRIAGTASEPFILWLYTLDRPRPVWANKTKPIKLERSRPINPLTNPQGALEQREHRRRQMTLHREPTFTETAETFRSIKGAIEAAHYWDDYMSGRITR